MWFVLGGALLVVGVLSSVGVQVLMRRMSADLALIHDGPAMQRVNGNYRSMDCWSCDITPASSTLGLCDDCERGLLPVPSNSSAS